MKTQIIDLAGMLFVLAVAIILPMLAGAELDRRGFEFDLARPAIGA